MYVCLFLDEIVSNGDTDYFKVDDFDKFDQILEQIRSESCRLATTTTTTTTTTPSKK